MKIQLNILLIKIIVLAGVSAAQDWQSEIVYYGGDGKLVYARDSLGNAIPDFSYAGYKNGNDTIPYVPVVKTISPVEGDNTTHINTALNEVAYFPVDENGFRGALLLEAGIYEVQNILYMKFPGVVIRGVGDGSDPSSNTILLATTNSPVNRTVLIAGGGSSSSWRHEETGTRTNILTDTVLVGESTFEVEDVSNYNVGDNIIIYHPCTDAWLEAIDYGGTHSDDPGAGPEDIPWEEDSQPLVFNRFITAIEGNEITIDVPVYNHLIRELSQSYIYKYTRSGIVTNLGIENLRIDIETSGSATDENHAWNAVDLYQIEDSYVRNCTFLHFVLSGIRTNTATRITIDNCRALKPVSVIEGGKRYNFNTYTASQQILFKDCHASEGRHSYVSNGMSWNSGIVFYNCTSEDAYAASEGHRRWSMGYLWDNHRELDNTRAGYNPRRIGMYNRGYYGTSHGWGIAHSVAWNCDVMDGEIIIQQPPTAQNYGIGCFGSLVAGHGSSSFDEPEGYIEGTNQSGLNPSSLYLAQLQERLDAVVSINNSIDLVPGDFLVYQNYPNPFNPTTELVYQLPGDSYLRVNVYNITGEKVRSLLNASVNAGKYNMIWNGKDDSGKLLSSGVYLITFESEFGIKIIKSMLMK